MARKRQVDKRMAKTVAIIQSNYIPWKGYFDIIDRSDELLLFDDIQYTKRDWRNRNKIKTPQGPVWLTIPVKVKGKYFQRICDTEVSDPSWPRKHWNTLSNSYRKAPHFATYKDILEELYLGCDSMLLSDVNLRFIRAFNEILGIETKLSWSMDYAVEEKDPTERLVALCLAAGATRYISGPSARDYIDESKFASAGIDLEFMNYEGYPEYDQLYPPFDHFVSVVDLILMCGPAAKDFIRR